MTTQGMRQHWYIRVEHTLKNWAQKEPPKNAPALAHSPWAHSKTLGAEVTTQKMRQH